MSYAQLSDVKSYLGITDNSQDDFLKLILDGTTGSINSMIGYDPVLGTTTETVSCCDIKNSEIMLHTPNITEVTKINGITYTGIKGTNYNIEPPQKRKLVIYDLYTYLSGNKFNYFDIEFKSGYAAGTQIMKDLKYLQILITQGEYLGGDIKTEKLGPRSVTFKDSSTFNIANDIVGKYRILNIL